jgi:uncharacterized protein YegJ (DUF2314 family)
MLDYVRSTPRSVVIPLSSTTNPLYVVYFAPTEVTPLAEELKRTGAAWSDAHLPPPLRDAAIAYRTAGLLRLEVVPAKRLPPPPLPLLHYIGMGELDERILQSAANAVVIGGPDLNAQPYAGLWSALATALGIRENLQGTLFDPQALRIIDAAKAPTWFAPDGHVAVAQHIQVPFSIQDTGLGWMTTNGLGKFGLPDLELRAIPPNLQNLSYLMNAAAQLLVEATSRDVVKDPKAAKELKWPAEATIDHALLGRALGGYSEGSQARELQVAIGLRFDPHERMAHPPMIQIVKPAGFSGDTGMWLSDILGRLVGSEHDVRNVRTSGDAMQQAHARAVSELPQVKQRFSKGLKPGEVLFIKHGFPTSKGDSEYLWVVANRWEGDRITGQVANDPNDVPGVVIGMTMVLREADVFDWTIQLPDGRSDGGYTTQVVLAEGQQQG